MAVKECPMCGESMRLREREIVDRVPGTPQTPFVTVDRKVTAWIKVQLRQHIGTDRYVLDFYGDIRVLGDPPAAEKATQKPNLELYVRRDTLLNAFDIPA